MNAPIDGRAGSLWRAATAPVRAVAPVALLARRAISGDYWVENLVESNATGPTVDVSDHDHVQPPEEGAGPLNHRRYTVRIEHPTITAHELIQRFITDPNRFSPTSYATFTPDPAPTGLAVGHEVEVKLPGPWNGPVRVRHLDDQSLRLETLDGHMEAGWIEFTCRSDDDVIVFAIESRARSGDAVFDSLYHDVGIGRLVQSQMWVDVLESAVQESGGRQQGRIHLDTIIYHGADQ